MNRSTENEILSILAHYAPVSIFELSNALNLTKADIRYHMHKLIKEGKVQKQKPVSGIRGRPAVRYELTNRIFPDNLEILLHALIYSNQKKPEFIQDIADYFVSRIPEEDSNLIIQKLNKLVIEFNNQNYAARWETQFSGPVIFFNNCPYRRIIDDHLFLCKLDQLIIEKYLGHKVTINHTSSNKKFSFCKFLVKI